MLHLYKCRFLKLDSIHKLNESLFHQYCKDVFQLPKPLPLSKLLLPCTYDTAIFSWPTRSEANQIVLSQGTLKGRAFTLLPPLLILLRPHTLVNSTESRPLTLLSTSKPMHAHGFVLDWLALTDVPHHLQVSIDHYPWVSPKYSL